MRILVAALAVALACAAPTAIGRSGGHSAGTSSHSSVSHHSSGSHSAAASYSSGLYSGFHGSSSHSGSHGKATPDVHHDSHDKVARSEKAKNDFKKQHPCPATGKSHGSCPGYVIDHITPLKRGGADAPYNMQWQTKAAAKAKDKWE